jgi:hypothetical protein
MKSLRSRVSITFPTLLSARPGKGVSKVGCDEVADLAPSADGGDVEEDQDVAFAAAGRPTRHRFSGAARRDRPDPTSTRQRPEI